MWEFILYSILFGLTAVSVYIITSNQNHQIRNQEEMIKMLYDIRVNVSNIPRNPLNKEYNE